MTEKILSPLSYVLPSVTTQNPGVVDRKTSFSETWMIKSNCKSKRIEFHITKFINQILQLPDSTSNKIKTNFTENVFNLQEIYPVGFIAPDTGLFIYFHPPEIAIKLEIVQKSIKWINNWDPHDYRSTDEYHLIIGDFVYIASRSERGLFYGLQTLNQFIKFYENRVPFQTIHDAPKLSVRAIHYDLKANLPNLDYLNWETGLLAEYKINSIVIEWEDKFPFKDDLAFLKHPGAFTEDEKKQLLTQMHLYYIEAIPLIQSLGHLEYVFKHENWKNLREVPITRHGTAEMICPTHPESLNAIKSMHTQILDGMEEHRDSKYCHIGMDETYYLGDCPKCQAQLGTDRNVGKSNLYITWLNQIAAFYFNQGKIPIIWGDMLVRYPQLLEKLDKRIIIMDWEYTQPLLLNNDSADKIDPTGESVDWVRTWDIKTKNQIENQPPPTAPIFKDTYWLKPDGKYPFYSFPYTRFFQMQGFKVMTAPAVQMGTETPGCPKYRIHGPNISYFNVIAQKRKALGSLCTNWTIRNSPWPMLQYGFLLHAETTWSGKLVDEENFTPKFFQNMYLGKVDANIGQFPNGCKQLFSTLGIYGENYDRLVAKLHGITPPKEKDAPIAEKITKYASNLLEIKQNLQNMYSHVLNNKKNFDQLIIFVEYAVFVSKLIPVCISIEDIAQKIEDDGNNTFSSLESLENLSNQAINLQENWSQLEPMLVRTMTDFLSPIEIPSYQKILINPIFNQIKSTLSPFPAFTLNIKKFVESIIERLMKLAGA
jgi:hypothetical protein